MTIEGRQNITAYLVGTDDNGKLKLNMYKYVSGSWSLFPDDTSSTIEIDGSEIVGTSTIKCEMTYNGKVYTDFITLEDKTDNYLATIDSSGGDVFKNTVGESTLTCRLFQNGVEVDTAGTQFTYKWYRRDKDGNSLDGGAVFATGKSVRVNGDDVDVKTTFTCEVE